MEETGRKHRSWDSLKHLFCLYTLADPFIQSVLELSLSFLVVLVFFKLCIDCNPLEDCEISVMGRDVSVMNCESIKKSVRMENSKMFNCMKKGYYFKNFCSRFHKVVVVT